MSQHRLKHTSSTVDFSVSEGDRDEMESITTDNDIDTESETSSKSVWFEGDPHSINH